MARRGLSVVPRRATARAAGLFGAIWLVWYNAVLKRAAHSTTPWGPRWLAVLASGMLYNFGRWYLRFSSDTEEKIREGVFRKGRPYVVSWHPHGAFTVAALYFFSHFWATDYPEFERGDHFVCVAPLLLRIPVLAEFLLLCHCRSQDLKTFDALLAKRATIAVQPGGIHEQVNTDHTQEKVFFPPKLGFIRQAIKHGTPLLPTYAFGENQLYTTAEWVRRLNDWFYRKFGSGNLVILGQGGVPNSPILPNPMMLPIFRQGLHIRYADVVEVGPADGNPSEEKVREVFARYVASLSKVFEQHKDSLLPKDVAERGLQITWRGGETPVPSTAPGVAAEPDRSKL